MVPCLLTGIGVRQKLEVEGGSVVTERLHQHSLVHRLCHGKGIGVAFEVATNVSELERHPLSLLGADRTSESRKSVESGGDHVVALPHLVVGPGPSFRIALLVPVA